MFKSSSNSVEAELWRSSAW